MSVVWGPGWREKLALLDDSIVKFDPGQPRDLLGRWSKVGAGAMPDLPEGVTGITREAFTSELADLGFLTEAPGRNSVVGPEHLAEIRDTFKRVLDEFPEIRRTGNDKAPPHFEDSPFGEAVRDHRKRYRPPVYGGKPPPPTNSPDAAKLTTVLFKTSEPSDQLEKEVLDSVESIDFLGDTMTGSMGESFMVFNDDFDDAVGLRAVINHTDDVPPGWLAEPSVKGVVAHELGHAFAIATGFERWAEDVDPDGDGGAPFRKLLDAHHLGTAASEYGNEATTEGFAEHFSRYILGGMSPTDRENFEKLVATLRKGNSAWDEYRATSPPRSSLEDILRLLDSQAEPEGIDTG